MKAHDHVCVRETVISRSSSVVREGCVYWRGWFWVALLASGVEAGLSFSLYDVPTSPLLWSEVALWVGDVAPLVEHLPSIHEIQVPSPEPHKTTGCGGTHLKSQHLGGGGRRSRNSKSSSATYSQFEASLGSIRLSRKKLLHRVVLGG